MRSLLLVCGAIVLWSSTLKADGFVLDRAGRYVPETEQQAYIEWHDGRERLYLATRTQATDGPSLWIVPVPGKSDEVQAEPIEEPPRVVYYRPVVKEAGARMRLAVRTTAWIASGFPLLPLLSMSKSAQEDGELTVHRRVEKLGMVVVVLSARTPDALDSYLRENGVNAKAANLASLTSYMLKDYLLVCGWTTTFGKPALARAVRIEFPSMGVFYPLMPSRIYGTAAIETTVYVQGWWRPALGSELSGLRCEYTHGDVKDPPFKSYASRLTLTRVTVSSLPLTWNEDVNLTPGAPLAAHLADTIGTVLWEPPVWGVVGLILSPLLPLVFIPAERRRKIDWVWSAGIGALMAFTLFPAAVLMAVWAHVRCEPEARSRWFRPFLILTSVLLGIVLYGTVVLAVYQFRSSSTSELLALPAACSLFLLPVPIAVLIIVTAGKRGLWLPVFAAAHLALFALLCQAVYAWMTWNI